ncbi:hypothetical protein ACU4GH_01440 [Bradyrhizobium betae]
MRASRSKERFLLDRLNIAKIKEVRIRRTSTPRQIAYADIAGDANRLADADAHRKVRAARACHQPMFTRPSDRGGREGSFSTAMSPQQRRIPTAADRCRLGHHGGGPCRAMAPMPEQAAQQLEPGVRPLKLNSDNAPARVDRDLNISGIPTRFASASGGREDSPANPARWMRAASSPGAETNLTRIHKKEPAMNVDKAVLAVFVVPARCPPQSCVVACIAR